MKMTTDLLAAFKHADAPLYAAPKSLQQAIEIKSVYTDGIFEVGNGRFSKSYLFSDINYVTANEDEQEGIFSQYCSFLNSLDVNYKLTLNNKNKDMDAFRRDILMQPKDDGLNPFRNEMNTIIEEKLHEGRQGIEQERYLTVTVERKNVEEARVFFTTLELNLKGEFGALGSELIALDGNERLHILYDFYHLGRENEYRFDLKQSIEEGKDFRNDLCNGMLQFYPDYFKDEHKFCRALFIKKYPNSLSDRFLGEIMSMPVHLMTSIDVVPIPKDVTVKVLQKKYLGIESDIVKQQQVRNRNNDFASGISYSKRQEKAGIEEIMQDVGDNDKCMFFVGVTFIVMAESLQELNSICETIETIGKRNSCLIERHYLMQREALNTTLPIGVRQVETMRTLLTDSLAVLMPFNIQELEVKQGHFYGVNQVSKNLCVGNRKKLVNGNGFIFAVPGAGKSFFAKTEMTNVILNTDDDVIVVDPQNEYFEIASNLNGAVIDFSNSSDHHINPLDIDLALIDPKDSNGLIRDKSNYVLGLCEQCMGSMVDVKVKAIVTRCVRNLYAGIAAKPVAERRVPLMNDLYELIKEQPELEAQDIALALELFIYGSLSIFNQETNVDVDNRFIVYGIRDMGKELAPVSMLVMMENISRKISENAKKGRATWLYIDELHVLLDKDYTAKYLFELWKKVRKQGGLCTGLTQNVVDLLQNYTAVTMLANSEFIVLLRQAATDARKLSELLGISDAHLRFVTNSPSGKGLMKHGSTIVPFDLTVRKDSSIYQLFNTNLHEKQGMM